MIARLKEMARAAVDSNPFINKWATLIQTVMGGIILAIVYGLYGVSQTASAAYDGVRNHETRISSLESSPVRISVLETKVDALTDQNNRLEEKIDRLTDLQMQQKRGQK
jgi:hypothetical protein